MLNFAVRFFLTTAASTAVISFAIVGCSPLQTSTSEANVGIIGGTPVSADSPIATMTAMLIDTDKGALCTASILNNEWLLTAGHCVADSQPENLEVVFAGTFEDFSNQTTPQSEMRKVHATFLNPRYTQTMNELAAEAAADKAAGRKFSATEIDASVNWGDIALVQIAGKIPHGKVAAQFLPAGTVLTVGESVVLAGYGQVGTAANSGYGSLQTVSVDVIDPARGGTEVLVDSTTKGACHGDSGGPAYLTLNGQLYLFGITSHGVGDTVTSQCVHQTAYTNAMSYQEWIASTMATASNE